MDLKDLNLFLSTNSYPGRGIVIGRSEDGKRAAIAYFIMGRSENSRNRVFMAQGGGIRTQAFDESKLTDPSLIIYSPVRTYENKTIVTNGDQTDTIYDGFEKGRSFADSLCLREFEPDGPNYTPRISGLIEIYNDNFRYSMSILKSDNGNPESCLRYFFYYENPLPGEGRFLHTYERDGNPLPSFEGEPKRVEIKGDLDEFTESIWDSLDADNKVSLFTRFIDLENGKFESKIVNKNTDGRV